MYSTPEISHELFGNGPISQVLGGVQGMRFDPGLLRPYIDDDPNSRTKGRPCVTLNSGRYRDKQITINGKTQTVTEPIYRKFLIADLQARGVNSPVFNATSLRKEEWLELDRVVLKAARYRMRAWSDLINANSFGGFNAMGKMILEHETMSDPGEALVDMDGLTEGRNDSPKFQLEGLPLPITHSDFWYSSRRLAISRNTGTPLDTTMGEAAGRRVAETIEKTTIGIQTGITYGGASTQVGGYGRTSAVYGYTNFPTRINSTGFYRPTGSGRSTTGWTPKDTLQDVLSCLDTLKLNKFYGPFTVYHSNDWDQYLDNDYQVFTTGGSNYGGSMTLRDRLRKIEGITDVKRLDFLFSSSVVTNQTLSTYKGPGGENLATTYPFTLVFVQMTPDVARAVNGMDLTTVQWESVGGMRLNFKVMCIQVPQLRADHYGNTGIMQATFDHA